MEWLTDLIDGIGDAIAGAFASLWEMISKPGTGCVYQINDTLWEGSFYPRMPDGKRKKFNVYAKTREECEEKLAELIKNHESRNRGDEKASEKRITKEGRPRTVAPQ